ncbi:hypothetical protein Tco_1437940 [Tanacetum coccineum]
MIRWGSRRHKFACAEVGLSAITLGVSVVEDPLLVLPVNWLADLLSFLIKGLADPKGGIVLSTEFCQFLMNVGHVVQGISLTGFSSSKSRSSNTVVLDSPLRASSHYRKSQSRQHVISAINVLDTGMLGLDLHEWLGLPLVTLLVTNLSPPRNCMPPDVHLTCYRAARVIGIDKAVVENGVLGYRDHVYGVF